MVLVTVCMATSPQERSLELLDGDSVEMVSSARLTYNVLTPFPVSENSLCYFATYLACDNLCPQSIIVYLSAIKHMQILPESHQFFSMAHLRPVQSGMPANKWPSSASNYHIFIDTHWKPH